jgi:predicted GNAT superfamily acetyltransferase
VKVRLRLLDTHADYRRAEELQRIVWGFADREIIPLNDLVPTQKHGGCVVGAFDGNRLIGLCVGCPAINGRKTYHYSRIMGVLPEYQDRGIGYKLKLFQRKQCLGQKLDLVRWTFDPLQARNAFFNLQKLGVIVREYTPNIYGDFSSSRFNSGLETDRFTPEWQLLSSRVKGRLAGRAPPRLDFREVTTSGDWEPGFRARMGANGLLQPIAVPPSRAPRLFAEIPADINELKRKDVTLARRWRRETRAFFMDAFRRGYVVHGFALDSEGTGGAYTLEKGLPSR